MHLDVRVVSIKEIDIQSFSLPINSGKLGTRQPQCYINRTLNN